MKSNNLQVEYPLINGTQIRACFFSIYLTNDEYMTWIYHNFIQLRCLKHMNMNYIPNSMDFFNSFNVQFFCDLDQHPMFDKFYLTKEFLFHNSNSLEYIIKKYIDLNKYVFVIYGGTNNYDKGIKRNNSSCYLINGYDDSKKVYKSGAMVGKDYEFLDLEYKIINDLYAASVDYDLQNKEVSHKNEFELLIFYPIANDEYNDNVNRSNNKNLNKMDILEQLLRYLKEDVNSKSVQYSYGINCYNELEAVVKCQINAVEKIDIRDFYTMKEQKKLMLMRINYLNNSGILDKTLEDYKDLYSEMKLLVNMIMKWNYSLNKNILPRIIIKMDEIRTKEMRLLESLVTNLKNV